MKIRNRLFWVILLIPGFMLLTSCERLFGVSLIGANKTYTVNLEINSKGTKLIPTTKPIGPCRAAHKKDGCIVLPHNKTATITFKLHASKKWYFSELRICEGVEKPGFCVLRDWQQKEFGAFIKTGDIQKTPGLDGIVKISSLSTKPVKSFKLADYNGVPQDYFYAIKACKGAGKEKVCVTTDPAIENKGRN